MSRSGMVGGRVLCAVRGGAACELVDEAWREAKGPRKARKDASAFPSNVSRLAPWTRTTTSS